MEVTVVRCPSCSAKIDFEAGATRGVCQYCGNVLVKKPKENSNTQYIEEQQAHARRAQQIGDYATAYRIWGNIILADPSHAGARLGQYQCAVALEWQQAPELYQQLELHASPQLIQQMQPLEKARVQLRTEKMNLIQSFPYTLTMKKIYTQVAPSLAGPPPPPIQSNVPESFPRRVGGIIFLIMGLSGLLFGFFNCVVLCVVPTGNEALSYFNLLAGGGSSAVSLLINFPLIFLGIHLCKKASAGEKLRAAAEKRYLWVNGQLARLCSQILAFTI